MGALLGLSLVLLASTPAAAAAKHPTVAFVNVMGGDWTSAS